MWIARDRDGSLWLYEDKPVRGKDTWECNENSPIKYSEIEELNCDFRPFSEVTWENSPLELIIKTEEK